MKEAENGEGKQTPPKSDSPDPGNEKLDKDMKGLVYQGEPTGQESSEPAYSEEKQNLEEKEPLILPESSSTVLDFTEKDSRMKAIILFAVVVIIIIGIVFLVLHKGSGPSKASTTSTIAGSAPTSTIGPNLNKTNLVNIDLLYNYTGPSTSNGQNCDKSKTSTVDGYSNHLNATNVFYIYDTETSSRCPLDVNKILVTAPGFKLISISPTLPINMPPNSSTYIIIKLETPVANYTGPLPLTIDEN